MKCLCDNWRAVRCPDCLTCFACCTCPWYPTLAGDSLGQQQAQAILAESIERGERAMERMHRALDALLDAYNAVARRGGSS